MRASALIAKIARIVSATGLVIVTVFWALILIKLAAGFATGGVDGARGNLHRLILMGSVSGQIDHDPIAAISRGYEGLIGCLVTTWVLREIYVLMGRKV